MGEMAEPLLRFPWDPLYLGIIYDFHDSWPFHPSEKKSDSTHVCNATTKELEAGGSGVQDHPQIHTKLDASLGYMGPCHRNTKKKKKPNPNTIFLHTCKYTYIHINIHYTYTLKSYFILLDFKTTFIYYLNVNMIHKSNTYNLTAQFLKFK